MVHIQSVANLLEDWGGIKLTHQPKTCRLEGTCEDLDWESETHTFGVSGYSDRWTLTIIRKSDDAYRTTYLDVEGGDNRTAIMVLAKLLELVL